MANVDINANIISRENSISCVKSVVQRKTLAEVIIRYLSTQEK